MDSSRALMLLQENLKRCLSFGCRIPINNNKDNKNGKVSCSHGRKNTTKGTLRQNFGWEGKKERANINTHVSENYNRPFSRWRHLITKTRVLLVVPIVWLYFKLRQKKDFNKKAFWQRILVFVVKWRHHRITYWSTNLTRSWTKHKSKLQDASNTSANLTRTQIAIW